MSNLLEVQVKPNENIKRTPLEHIAKYTGSSSGAIRGLQVVQKTAKIINQIGQQAGASPFPGLAAVDEHCGNAMSWISVIRLPGAAQSAIESFSDLRNAITNKTLNPREVLKAVRGGADGVLSFSSAAGMFINSAPLKKMRAVLDLTSDVADGVLAAQDLHESSKMLNLAVAQKLPEMVQTAIGDSKKHAILKVVKAALAIIGGIAGVAGLVATGVLAIVLIVISLASVIFAITAHFYKQTRPYEIIDFFKNPVVLTPVLV